jgi:soluble cytochrome b562
MDDTKMRKHLIAMVAVALLGSSSMVLAADVGTNMDTIADNYGKALKAGNAQDFEASLANMKAAALDAKNATPPKLEGKAANSPEIQDYKKGMDELVAGIDKASALAKAGKLDDAKKEAQGFKAIRDENHKKFR